jgi:hypothetical protein
MLPTPIVTATGNRHKIDRQARLKDLTKFLPALTANSHEVEQASGVRDSLCLSAENIVLAQVFVLCCGTDISPILRSRESCGFSPHETGIYLPKKALNLLYRCSPQLASVTGKAVKSIFPTLQAIVKREQTWKATT